MYRFVHVLYLSCCHLSSFLLLYSSDFSCLAIFSSGMQLATMCCFHPFGLKEGERCCSLDRISHRYAAMVVVAAIDSLLFSDNFVNSIHLNCFSMASCCYHKDSKYWLRVNTNVQPLPPLAHQFVDLSS